MDERLWSVRSDVFVRRSATSLIVLPAEGPAVRLNGPAEAIWALIQTTTTADVISVDLAALFAKPVEEVRPFVVETLERLDVHGTVDVR